MRDLLAIAISAILASCAGWLAQQFAALIEPGTTSLARTCIGTAIFAGALLGCLLVTGLQRGEG